MSPAGNHSDDGLPPGAEGGGAAGGAGDEAPHGPVPSGAIRSGRLTALRTVPKPLLGVGVVAVGFVVAATVIAFGYGNSGRSGPEALNQSQIRRLLGSTGATTPVGFYRVDKPAPAFVLPPVIGTRPVDPRHFAGHPIVLNFWYSTCPPCIAEAPVLASVSKATAGKVTFIGVDYEDSKPSAAAFIRAHGENYPDGFDSSGRVATGLYGIPGTPTTYFLSTNGRRELGVAIGQLSVRSLTSDLRAVYGIKV